MANKNPLISSNGSLSELTATDALNVPGSLVVAGVTYVPGLVPGAVQAPSTCIFDHANYTGTTEYITWRANNGTAYKAGAIEFYGWQDSADGTTWGTETFHGDTYQGAALTTGNQYARVRAYPLTTNGVTITPSGWVTSTVQVYAANPVTSGINITESIGNGADIALTTAYQTISTISISVAANAAVGADALVEVVADVTTGNDDLYLQLYDTVAASAILYSERHVSNVTAGKRGQILLSKYVGGTGAGRTLVLQAKNATAARGSVNTNKSLLQVLNVSSGVTSGGGISSPTQVAGLTLWLNAGAITGIANGAALATWADTSGGSHSAAQATTALQPLYIASGLNGKPVVRFNGSSQFMTLGNLSSFFPSAASMFVVVTYNGSQYQCVYSTTPYNSTTNAGDDFWYYTGNTGAYLSVFGSTRSGSYAAGTMTTTGANLYSLIATPTTGELWLNQIDKGSFSQTFTGGTSHLLGHSNNSANNVYLNGDISELLIYSSALSVSDRQNVEGYLKAKYGI